MAENKDEAAVVEGLGGTRGPNLDSSDYLGGSEGFRTENIPLPNNELGFAAY